MSTFLFFGHFPFGSPIITFGGLVFEDFSVQQFQRVRPLIEQGVARR